jgi:hypothetical protein
VSPQLNFGRKDTMKPNAPRTLAISLLLLGACSPTSATSSASGNGGKKADTVSGVGGTAGSGGSASNSSGKGGNQGSGGSSATGGNAGSGGKTSDTGGSGGTAGSGGASTGGSAATGGSGSGGVAGSGGSQATGGSARDAGPDGSTTGGRATGGSTTGGVGGSAAGGSAIGGSSTGGTLGSTINDGCTDQLAKGITISEIAVFQAGKISVMKGGAAVTAKTTSGAEIIQGKDGLFRIYVTVDGGFQSRSLSARLKLNGQTVGLYAKATISASSTELSTTNSFTIAVPASVFGANLDYQAQIVECGDGSGTDHNPIFPTTGAATLATRKTGVVKITMMPATSGGVTPTLDQSFIDSVKKTMDSMYPTTDTQITVSATALAGCTVTGATAADDVPWSNCLDRLRSRRTADKPASDVYYVAVLKPESTFAAFCGSGCITGISLVATATSANSRISLVDGYLPDALITIPHEVGHAHGIEHSPGCGAAQADPSFPYVTSGKGYIGWVGWDKQQSPIKFFDPAKYIDIMAYCSPQWVSDYVYKEMATRIITLNGARIAITEAESTWRVALETSGKLRWGIPITEPVAPEGEPVAATVLDAQGTAAAQITVYRTGTSHGGASYMVPDPQAGWATLQIGSSTLAF